MKTIISGGFVINEGEVFPADIVLEDEKIKDICNQRISDFTHFDNHIAVDGMYIIPGVIDEHVHFREPGLTNKADIHTESIAAVAGGVTTFFDMPNTFPPTTDNKSLHEKLQLAEKNSVINFSFFIGADKNNHTKFQEIDKNLIPGIKLYMGSTTGNMLVDQMEYLEKIFSSAPLPIMTHCEDSNIINRNMAEAIEKHGGEPPITFHPVIRSAEACLKSTMLAIRLAEKYNKRLHVAHLSTACETELFGKSEHITAEAVLPHILYCDEDYQSLGTRIKCNPAIKTKHDRDTIRVAIRDGRISAIATDHAPHLLKDKEGGVKKAASGIPFVQFALPTMLELVDQNIIELPQMVKLMSHNPAKIFDVNHRGFIRKDYFADLTIIQNNQPWTVTQDKILSKCGWSPLLGHTFNWTVKYTICNGNVVYDNGRISESHRGKAVTFR